MSFFLFFRKLRLFIFMSYEYLVLRFFFIFFSFFFFVESEIASKKQVLKMIFILFLNLCKEINSFVFKTFCVSYLETSQKVILVTHCINKNWICAVRYKRDARFFLCMFIRYFYIQFRFMNKKFKKISLIL